MTSTYRFWVERKAPDGDWQPVLFAESNTVQYCHGFVDAMDSVYPSVPCRICKMMPGGAVKVLRETKGRGKVKVN